MSTKRIAFKVHGTVQGTVSPPPTQPTSLIRTILGTIPRSPTDDIINVDIDHHSDFAQKSASSLGLQGYVRNTTCGRVEGEAQGSGETVQKFLQQINKGPRTAQVVKLEKREMEPREGEDRFLVMRTSESMFGSEG
ncbi:hypothetical protein N7510_006176 [Penicillium lagena]|uniref:uncharacterized protein n=1 Tax=Penicillium lagena TaxID=94218 RepID=UPI00253FECBE|nr:uncharacterized protein N7510_006176 [Penicillium lagena]KAJ5612982.1 hypothetical protein N7510_006176 [Penicillium lagena]